MGGRAHGRAPDLGLLNKRQPPEFWNGVALYTQRGLWEHTEPVQVELKRGRNVLRFSHKTDGYDKGFSIKEFQLAPVPAHARVK